LAEAEASLTVYNCATLNPSAHYDDGQIFVCTGGFGYFKDKELPQDDNPNNM
jgi:hypothetical protein